MNKFAIIFAAGMITMFALICVVERKRHVDNKALILQQDSIIQQNAMYRDSIDAAFSKTRDSLDIAFATIRQINSEKQQAIEHAQQVTKRYERIQFQKMRSDQERDSILHELYPTMK